MTLFIIITAIVGLLLGGLVGYAFFPICRYRKI